MATITIELPDNTPVAVLGELADKVGCELRMVRDGSFKAVPKEGGAKIVRFPAKPRGVDGGAA